MTSESFFERIGIRTRLIQAPMAGCQDHRLAVAAAHAGALGSIPSAQMSPSTLRAEALAFRASTSAPLNLNFFTHRQEPLTPHADQQWRDCLRTYYNEFDLDPTVAAPAVARLPFGDAFLDVIEEVSPEVVSFHFGLPEQHMLNRVRASGALVIASATTLEEGLWLESRGADAIIAQGLQAGGHRGMFLGDDLSSQVDTLTLVSQLLGAVSVPVIAAGGIGDSAAASATRRAGAVGVQVGTAFLCCPEATTSAVHRAALGDPRRRPTALTNVFTGRPARGIVNRVMRELGPISPVAPPFPHAGGALAPLRAHTESFGVDDFSPLWAGENYRCHGLSAAEVVDSLADDLFTSG